MNTEELLSLIKGGESETVEFKESLDEEAVESIAAFANTKGGTLLVGITDHGQVKGVAIGKETLRDWANHIGQATSVHPEIISLAYEGKTIVVVQVSQSSVKPIPCRGRYFKRVGKSNRKMTDDDLTRTVLDKVGLSWDEVVEPRATLSDLDHEQIHRFRNQCNQKGRRRIPTDEDDATVLDKLGLLQDGRVLRAAVLLFAKEPQRFYPSAFVKVGRFRSPTHIVDDREIYGVLSDQVEGVMGYFREHLATRFEFAGEAAREVIWEYPLEALREAITNAVCHRDYLDTAHTQVRWYDDRLVFMNSGGLLPPLRIEDLKREHKSNPRNHKIAEMFFYAGLIERWGSGVEKILDESAAAGLPEPEYEEKQGGLWLTFSKAEAFLESLNQRQKKAWDYLREKETITRSLYAELCRCSIRTAVRDLEDMLTKGLIKRAGIGKNTYYQRSK